MNIRTLLLYSGILIGGFLLGYLIFGGSSEPQTIEEHIAETHTNGQGEIIYTCSMHPQIREDGPGNCPICGMELIPAGDSGNTDVENDYTLTMTNAAVQLADIQTTEVKYGHPIQEYNLPGKIEENRNNVSTVTAHFPGRIRQLYIDYEGLYVEKGTKLASVYSPELIAAQQELLETAKYREQNPRLYQAARQKLRLWEFPENTINEIIESGEVMTELDFYSPVSGFISEVAIAREEHVMEGDLMYRIVDLSSVWVDFQAYESELTGIKKGDNIQFNVEAFPGVKFESTVMYVDPFLNDESRSVTIRSRINNPDATLKPGMLAKATVRSSISDNKVLLVPASAVMWTGKRSVVYVQVQDTSNPTFEARELVIGPKAGNQYVVLSGVQEGELVVTHGTFKLDSEAQLRDKLSMMNREPGSGNKNSGHNHGSTSADNLPEAGPNHSEVEATRSMMSIALNDTLKSEKVKIDSLVHEYLITKNALTRDNIEEAKEHIGKFIGYLENFDPPTESHFKKLKEVAVELNDKREMENFRLGFKTLSAEFIEYLKVQNYQGDLFVQYCPMYKGGSSWISDKETIENPFYGSQMHNCGETVNKLNSSDSKD